MKGNKAQTFGDLSRIILAVTVVFLGCAGTGIRDSSERNMPSIEPLHAPCHEEMQPVALPTEFLQVLEVPRPPVSLFCDIDSSHDGTTLIAGAKGVGGGLYVSHDGGKNWTSEMQGWFTSTAVSADGNILWACGKDIY